MRKLNQQGFTLIELMMVVAIIGILASVAVPQYQTYMDKARVSEALNAAGHVKKLYDTWWAETGTCPQGISSVGITDSTLPHFPYVASVTNHSRLPPQPIDFCGFRIRFQATGNSDIDSNYMFWYSDMIAAPLRPAGRNTSISWVCVSDLNIDGSLNTVLRKYLPSVCKRRFYSGGANGLPYSSAYWY